MEKLTFPELTEKIQQHFAVETYQEGLTLASEQLPNFPEEYALINYWRICLAARLEQFEIAAKILESTLASGIWYSDVLLRESPSLAGIQGQGEFERLAEIAGKLRAADGSDVPLLLARPEDACQPGDAGCPLLVFLHANSDTAQNNLQHWAHLSAQGWLAAIPQSSWGMWTGAYGWTGYEATRGEILDHYESLKRQYSVDASRMILGGFSMGGAMALSMVLNGDLPAQGFILLGPAGGMIDEIDEIKDEDWWAQLGGGWTRSLRGVVLMGEADDTIPQDKIRKLVRMLNDAGIPTRLQTFPGLRHDYPPDFETVAAQALGFIFSLAE
jgi:predicted esterase